jgi:diguanylate cyclase (GGDEF)-like protein
MPRKKTTKRPLPGTLDLVFSTFIEVTGLITTGASISRIVTPILSCAVELLDGSEAFALLESDKARTRVSWAADRGGRSQVKTESMTLTGLAGKIFRARSPAVLPGVAPGALASISSRKPAEGKVTVISAPLKHNRSRIGAIGVISSHIAEPDRESLDLFRALADQAALAIKNAREFERTQILSITDGLTGAYNYRFMVDATKKEIGRAERFGEIFSLLMIDVDSLKDYNDVHGHLKGSGVIKKVAHLTAEKLRSIDMLCKYGGDEFVVILPRAGKAGAAHAAERIRRAIDEYVFPGERKTGKITASMGIASFPDDGRTFETLISSADKALYRAKRTGRNRIWISGEKKEYTPA